MADKLTEAELAKLAKNGIIYPWSMRDVLKLIESHETLLCNGCGENVAGREDFEVFCDSCASRFTVR